jgi:hypothetical protein
VSRSQFTLSTTARCKPLVIRLPPARSILRLIQTNHALLWAKFAMDITDKILAEFHQENQSEKLNFSDMIAEFSNDVLWLEKSDTNEIESQLMKSQYAYVKFGMLLERIGKQCMWKNWQEKFSDFRQFCQTKVNLNIWQVSNAIKSAKVAIQLSFMGFEELPRNASQALKLSGLSVDRLGEVWENILKKCAGHKITAAAIEQEIHPDAQPMRSSVMLPVELADKLSREAVMRGISVAEYIGELMDLEQAESEVVDRETLLPNIEEEIADLLDRVEVVSIEPVKIIKSVGNSIDRMRQAMYDRYLPKWKSEVSYE